MKGERTENHRDARAAFVIPCVLAIAMSGAGCPKAGTAVSNAGMAMDKANHTVTVLYGTDHCPNELDAGQAYPDCGSDKRCISVNNGEVVAFVAKEGGEEFALQFGPFKHDPEMLTSNKGRLVVPVNVYHQKGKSKTFNYNVLSTTRPGCTPLDPQIIVNN